MNKMITLFFFCIFVFVTILIFVFAEGKPVSTEGSLFPFISNYYGLSYYNETGFPKINDRLYLSASFGSNISLNSYTFSWNCSTKKWENDTTTFISPSNVSYQENPSEYSCSDDCSLCMDGDWDSPCGNVNVFYINYTKPPNATNHSLWQVSLLSTNSLNLSIPSDCWSYSNTKLLFRINSTQSANNGGLYCYNGAWKSLLSNTNNLKEEAMWWNTTSYMLSINKSINATNHPHCGWQVHFNDTDGTRNQTDIFTFDVVNTAPDTPTLTYPADKSSIIIQNTTLNWTSTDADNDSLIYYVYADTNANPTTLVWYGSNMTSNYTHHFFNFTGLIDGNTYYWKVQSSDNLSNSSNSSIRMFYISTSKPAITIDYPLNNSWNNSQLDNISIRFSVSSIQDIGTCQLWINSTGWHNNQSISYDLTYQEDADEIGLNGSWSDGSYVYDGEWDTYGTCSGTPFCNPNTLGFYFVNYTKPSTSTNHSLWHIKTDTEEIDIPINKSCWDYNPEKLIFRVYNGGSNWYCSNETDNWVWMYDGGQSIYEEAMNWNLTSVSNDSTFRINLTDETQYKYNIWCNNTLGQSGWYPFGNITFGIDTIKPNMNVSSPLQNTTYHSQAVTLSISSSDKFLSNCSYVLYFRDVPGSVKDSNNSINCSGSTRMVTTYYAGGYTLNVSSYDLAGNVNYSTIDFTTQASSETPPSTNGGGGTTYVEQIVEKEVTVIDRCGNLICDEDETPYEWEEDKIYCPTDCKLFDLGEIFCTPIFNCGNWNRQFFLNFIILLILVGMIYGTYKSGKKRRPI